MSLDGSGWVQIAAGDVNKSVCIYPDTDMHA
jgi:hypothetical protein